MVNTPVIPQGIDLVAVQQLQNMKAAAAAATDGVGDGSTGPGMQFVTTNSSGKQCIIHLEIEGTVYHYFTLYG
jgi:hypothetical protein